jgi:hypothetical protein
MPFWQEQKLENSILFEQAALRKWTSIRHRRWRQRRGHPVGCSTERLSQELGDRRHRKSLRTLRRLAARLRRDAAVSAPPTPAPPVNKVASGSSPPWGGAALVGGDGTALAQITARTEELQATCDVVRGIANMLRHRRGEHLGAWTSQAASSSVSELRGFNKGARKGLGRRHRRAYRLLQLRRRRRRRQPRASVRRSVQAPMGVPDALPLKDLSCLAAFGGSTAS